MSEGNNQLVVIKKACCVRAREGSVIATFSSTFMLECAFLVLEWLMPKKGRFHRENSLSE